MKYTKYTIVSFKYPKLSFTDTLNSAEIDFVNDAFQKAMLMTAEGKTPGHHEDMGDGSAKRLWIDMAAAEEWKQFIFDNAQKHNIEVLGVEIFDATEKDNI